MRSPRLPGRLTPRGTLAPSEVRSGIWHGRVAAPAKMWLSWCMRSIAFTAHKIAELVEVDDEVPLRPGEVRALTVVSLTSPGTELNGGYLGDAFPKFPGYAAVAEVVETGPEVETVRPGDVVLCPGTHSDVVRCAARDTTPVPPGLLPEVAVFARLLGVGLSAVNVMSANPPSRVLVTGLGPIGNLAAQVVSACGFTVTSVDPVASRRDLAKACGLSDVRADLGELGRISRTLSEHTSSAAARSRRSCPAFRLSAASERSCWWAFHGGARLISPRTHLLDAIFRRYVSVRSGWEWQVPRYRRRPAQQHRGELRCGLRVAARRSRPDRRACATLPSARSGRGVPGLAERSLPTISAIFDWRRI